MGASPYQIITRVLVPEGLPSIVAGITITTINLIGYSAMAGVIGGGLGMWRLDMDIMRPAQISCFIQLPFSSSWFNSFK